MDNQYGFTPEDYVYDLKNVSNARYNQGMLFVPSFSKQLFKSLMLYDFIYHIPQQVSLSICKQ